ncbi:hypothetical protein AXG93_3102s1090 [Marchantia polymorpha subsp. ruderalis]|uniref:Uncharacterized protein n=1 Tax=Marchantia polymorpha subsp. ruderalis TaxID=1480154 RepID=A0A176W9D4_MARPO|nr:hypothetical protein AXG93_3102s1090 [Marchantia polymorpha subsp. ruderalis]
MASSGKTTVRLAVIRCSTSTTAGAFTEKTARTSGVANPDALYPRKFDVSAPGPTVRDAGDGVGSNSESGTGEASMMLLGKVSEVEARGGKNRPSPECADKEPVRSGQVQTGPPTLDSRPRKRLEELWKRGIWQQLSPTTVGLHVAALVSCPGLQMRFPLLQTAAAAAADRCIRRPWLAHMLVPSFLSMIPLRGIYPPLPRPTFARGYSPCSRAPFPS